MNELLTEQYLCTFLLPVCNRDKWQQIDLEKWIYDTIQSKPQVAQDNNFINHLYERLASDQNPDTPWIGQKPKPKNPIKIAMFTDLHVDYDYTVGKSKTCLLSECCRSDSGDPVDASDAAREWGELHCDLPEKTMMNMFEFIHDEIRPDLAFWGGDTVPHNVDSLTEAGNVDTMRRTYRNVLKGMKEIQTFMTPGNHDSYPQDSFKGHKAK